MIMFHRLLKKPCNSQEMILGSSTLQIIIVHYLMVEVLLADERVRRVYPHIRMRMRRIRARAVSGRARLRRVYCARAVRGRGRVRMCCDDDAARGRRRVRHTRE